MRKIKPFTLALYSVAISCTTFLGCLFTLCGHLKNSDFLYGIAIGFFIMVGIVIVIMIAHIVYSIIKTKKENKWKIEI